jgi:drug/metabolite transporter (DMT)-like permease
MPMDSTLTGEANLLVLPNLDAANILFNVLKMTGGHGVTVGPILLGAAKPVHILTPSATVRRIVNMTAAPAAHGGILLPGLQPFLITALAWWWMGARPSSSRLLGLVPIAAGVACVAMPVLLGSHQGSSTLAGDALLLGASIAWASYSVLVKKWAFDPWLLTRFVALASTLVFMPVYLAFLPKGLDQVPTSMLLLQGLYQGLGPTIVAMLLYLRAVAILGPERTGALVALVPVIAGLGAVPLLNEPLTGWLIAGLVLVSGGAFLSARFK